MMHRDVFERINTIDGMSNPQTAPTNISSIVVSPDSTSLSSAHLFVGSNEGALSLYKCSRPVSRKQPSTSVNKLPATLMCSMEDAILRKPSREKKAVLGLVVMETWRVMIGIFDGTLCSYDLLHFHQITSVSVTANEPNLKGICSVFAVHERAGAVVVGCAGKKRLYAFAYSQSGGFQFRRELAVVDVPRTLLCLSPSSGAGTGTVVVVAGYKKFYESLELSLSASAAASASASAGTQTASALASRILDVEKEHKMIALELPESPFRPRSVLLSLGSQGVILDAARVSRGESFSFGPAAAEERLEWISAPTAVVLASNLFLLSLLASGPSSSLVEIHDLLSLQALQKIPLQSSAALLCPLLLPASAAVGLPRDLGGPELHVLVGCADQIYNLRMVPVAMQVDALVAVGSYEQALRLCGLCDDATFLRGVDVRRLHELQATALWQKGDFEQAAAHFLKASTALSRVLRLVPEIVPASLSPLLEAVRAQHSQPQGAEDKQSAPRALSGAQLQRAAAALVSFCDGCRPNLLQRAAAAELRRTAGLLSAEDAVDLAAAAEAADPEAEIRQAELLDSILVAALLGCFPQRRAAVVSLLAGRDQYAPPLLPAPAGPERVNYCQLEGVAPLFSVQGNALTEALLWLFRSQKQHIKVLAALREESCVGAGAWSREQFFLWTAEYLQWLWHQEDDLTLPGLALQALKPVLEFDAELGLSVLIVRPASASASAAKTSQSQSFGGRGVTVKDVLLVLRTALPSPSSSSSAPPKKREPNPLLRNAAHTACNSIAASVLKSSSLLSGPLLETAFLECLVSSPDAPPALHEEFAQLLIEGLPLTSSYMAATGDLYRSKLQRFLANSAQYRPQRLAQLLPPLPSYPEENALLLSRLGRHRAVLEVYVHLLQDPAAAEDYCQRIYSANLTQQTVEDARESADIYLTLLEVVLRGPDRSSSIPAPAAALPESQSQSQSQSLAEDRMISLAEKYHQRLSDPFAPLALLPGGFPLQRVAKYASLAMEFAQARRRSLLVTHQLLRVREVDLRISEPPLR